MGGLLLVLTSLVILAPPEAAPGRPSFDVDAILRRVADMPPEKQQQWLQDLRTRLHHAADATLPDDEAVLKKAQYDKLLQQKTISRELLIALVKETEIREQAAVAKLAREYRVQVYESYHDTPDVYAARQEVTTRVFQAWNNAGQPFDQQGKLVEWLQAALRNANPLIAGPMPAPPHFEAATATMTPPKTEKPEDGGKAASKSGEKSEEKAGTKSGEKSNIKSDESSATSSRAMPSVTRHVLPAPVAIAEVRPQPLEPARLPMERPVAVAGAVRLIGQPVSRELPADSVAGPLRPVVPRLRQFENAHLVAMSEHVTYATAGLARARLAANVSVDVVPATEVADEPPSAATVEVNVPELNARIGGYNLTLHALEAELDEHRGWTAQRLRPLVERLKNLVAQKADLAVYRQLVPERDRFQLGDLESPRAVLSQLGRSIFEARTRAAGPDFQGREEQRRAELDRLDALSRDLVELAR